MSPRLDDSSSPVIRVEVASGFDDPLVSHEAWHHLLSLGTTNEVFLTRQWQQAWWESFGRGTLLMLVAMHEDTPTALAPIFTDSGMGYFVGSGASDYLDFIGIVQDVNVLKALLQQARSLIPRFVGFLFYHVPSDSPTGSLLTQVACQLGLRCYEEASMPAPRLEMSAEHEVEMRAAPQKKSLRRHEGWFRKHGRLAVSHDTNAAEILPHLDTFFDQHVARWESTETPSLFVNPAHRDFYRRLTMSTDVTDWLRFTRVDWNEHPIAFHFGFCYERSYLWYKPSFEIDLMRRSPGEVLLRQLLLAAIAENCAMFRLWPG